MSAQVLILTPMKNAAHEVDEFIERLRRLTYPAGCLSLGVLVSDSDDGTFEAIDAARRHLVDAGWRRTTLLRRDFGYRIPEGLSRHEPMLQFERRRVLALSRNHLLFGALLPEHEWVLWLDADVVGYQTDIVELLTSFRRDIIQPHCVVHLNGPTFDLNAWRDHGRIHMEDLRGTGLLVELHAVGGTMLLVRADRHRDGLIFPPFGYGTHNPRIRPDANSRGREEPGEIETEGLGIMANDMGIAAWGLPELEIRHRDG